MSSTVASEWTRRRERGSLPLVRFMVWFSLHLGRRPARVLLRIIVAYFLLTGGDARRASRDYLARVLGRAPKFSELYGLFFSFGSTVHDRVFFLKGRYDLFEVTVHGAEIFENEPGAFLMGAHLGSFEAIRAAGHQRTQRAVAMAMYEENARRLNTLLLAIDPTLADDIVPLGHIDSMLVLRSRLDAGAMVGVLADRTLGNEPMIDVDFLGSPAPFPTGPMRMAAALRRKVIFMTGLYRGGNRYEIHFESLADFSRMEETGPGARAPLVDAAVRRYAGLIERYCRAAPDNWFNFHPFWHP